MGALLSFLGGSAFRMIWGEVSSYFSKKQEHKTEMQRMLLQGKLDDAAHARNLAGIRLQAELGIKTIQVQADAAVSEIEADTWRQAVARANTPTGIKWVDAWNASVRPAFATAALCLWLFHEFRHMALNGWVITAFSLELICVVAGFYFADRTMKKAGK